ncbi:hypothetical protein [Streptomyces hydrogenans]|uniref:hypothetical protein n=1 Tax=Streptomyces hydrogenans TaxID=1873719 RepID=UPI003812583E
MTTRICEALSCVWKRIMAAHADVPQATPFLATRKTISGRKHFDPEWWLPTGSDQQPVPEFIVSAEDLGAGPEETLNTIVHTAVHFQCQTRNKIDLVKGCYHNANFRDAALVMGLCCEKPSKKYGYLHTAICAETAPLWQQELHVLDLALTHFRRPDPEEAPPQGAAQDKKVSGVCECQPEPRTVSLPARFVRGRGPILCTDCNEPFDFPL